MCVRGGGGAGCCGGQSKIVFTPMVCSSWLFSAARALNFCSQKPSTRADMERNGIPVRSVPPPSLMSRKKSRNKSVVGRRSVPCPLWWMRIGTQHRSEDNFTLTSATTSTPTPTHAQTPVSALIYRFNGSVLDASLQTEWRGGLKESKLPLIRCDISTEEEIEVTTTSR